MFHLAFSECITLRSIGQFCRPAAADGDGDSNDDDINVEVAPGASCQVNQGATFNSAASASADPHSTDIPPLTLPKHIHSAASLVNGSSFRPRAAPSQSDAIQDPMRLSNDAAQVKSERKSEVEIGRASVPHDQTHWQDEYATNWDRISMGRNASSSDAAAAAMQQVSCPSGLHDHLQAKSGKGKAWACQLCTFAANPSHSIRCEVCDTVRGSTLQHYRPPAVNAREAVDARPSTQTASSTQTEQQVAIPSRRKGSKGLQHTIAKFLGSAGTKCAEVDTANIGSPDSTHNSAHVEHKEVEASGWIKVELHAEVRWQCRKCKCWFQTGQKAEHDDYHLALELQQQSTYAQQPQHSVKRLKACKAAH